ncbi:LysM and putative peptidoglycan-binding domain-containing protein 3 [Frankliniella fusca]|uniref:LysM and putative peptidoglycan-binding domain-containing protein 3 n=1 Tax=Frankliniella fusca TaxID=407009 RepID=A0AAE1GQF9_9NEOP|nr:LysM and putative peptidoglycan-binding domain-containing protein 3 [Frankliniella fusca]
MNSRYTKQRAYLRPREQDLEYENESLRLLEEDDCESGPEELHSGRKFALRPKKPTAHYVEHTLQSGDTLSSLALRYNCSVAQIKQANNILRENEVFALRKIRIPVSAFSSFRHEVPGVHSSHSTPKKTSECDELNEVYTMDTISSEGKWVEEIRVSPTEEALRDPLLTPIPVPRLPLVDLSDTESPDLELVSSYKQVKEQEGIFHCSGADCGISWVALVVCTLVLGFIYVFFLYEHEHERKMHNQTGT